MPTERVVLVGLQLGTESNEHIDFSMAELARLADTAGGEVVHTFTQKRSEPTPQYLIGEGKIFEIAAFCDEHAIATVVFNDALSPAQQHNCETKLNCKVIDRTRLILDIFAHRSRSREGKLQVELAQLQYLLPRLTGKGIALSQQTGGIGTRGPGEQKLEVDSRRIRDRIARLTRAIETIRTTRATQKAKRNSVPVPLVALVGYTNAGKSTLMNLLTRADIFVEDKLFATLDPTIRRLKLTNGQHILLADTVGFIEKLPHELVAAFRATLEEIKDANIVMHVVDVSDATYETRIKAVHQVLEEIGAHTIPRIIVYNKIDMLRPAVKKRLVRSDDIVAISSKTGENMPRLLETVTKVLQKDMLFARVQIPYSSSRLVHYCYEKGIVKRIAHNRNFITIDAMLDPKLFEQLKPYIHNN